MKKYFLTGLVILLPLALTLAIVIFLFNLLTAPFLGFVKTFFDHYDLFERGFLFLNADQIQNFVAQILIFFSLFFIAVGLGFVAHWFFFKTFLKFAEIIVKKIPLISTIYKACQEVTQTLFSSKNKSFKQVVLAPFPHAESHAIGFITREEISQMPHENVVSVFIPTTPNPTSGFVMMFQKKDLIYLDLKVEDAFKYIISCGMISCHFRAIEKDNVKEESLSTIELP